MEDKLRQIIEGVSNTYGENFFNAITLQLAKIIEADYTFIAKLDHEKYSSRTIALVHKNELLENFEYSLEYTPCANVADNSVCMYPGDVTNLFPKDQLLIDMNIEGYLGTPLLDSNGKVMGLIVALYEQEIKNSEQTLTLFEIFSGRIAAEMDRVAYQNQLIDLNAHLEDRVKKRTADLNQALIDLRQTQDQLIESEKFAALGNLVASVAHEVNTPLGVAITGHSFVCDNFYQLQRNVIEKQLSRAAMDDFLTISNETLPLISENLGRAKDLIDNFKNIAADQYVDVEEEIKLKPYYDKLINTLKPMMKRNSVSIEVDIDESIQLKTTPGVHSQIISNLISNSLKHGLQAQETGQIIIRAQSQDNSLKLIYQDNGRGLTFEERENIFQPFYTTARTSGGTGLGMAIVYNLVKQKLHGDIQLLDTSDGFGLQITLPMNN